VIYFHLARAYYDARRQAEAVKALQEAEALKLRVTDLHPLERADYQHLRRKLTRQ
jgi:hypothetical protein